MSDYRLAAIEPAHTTGIKAVLAATPCLGEPLPFPVQDWDRLADYYVDFYLAEEPEAGRVVLADDGRVVGCLLGTTKLRQYAHWQRREALRLAARWAARWRRYDAFTRWFYRLRIADAREVLRDPDQGLEAHFHWNLLPEVRGRFGREFLWHFRNHVADRGLKHFGGEQSFYAGDTRPRAFERLGGTLGHRAPHHTLTALMGRPVERVTILGNVDTFHW